MENKNKQFGVSFLIFLIGCVVILNQNYSQ